MEQPFSDRGKRTDEMLELMQKLWSPGWAEFDGEFYQTPRLEMEPTPPRIPVYVGGLGEIALRRAARYDGWIGDLIKTDRAIAAAARLRELRIENGLSVDDFTILTPLTDAFTVADYQRAEDAGITGILTMPLDVLHRAECHARREGRRHEEVPQGPRARRVTRPGVAKAFRRPLVSHNVSGVELFGNPELVPVEALRSGDPITTSTVAASITQSSSRSLSMRAVWSSNLSRKPTTSFE